MNPMLLNESRVWHGLPPEILRYVLRFSCQQSKRSCSALRLASSWTNIIATPILFHTITLTSWHASRHLAEVPLSLLLHVENIYICLPSQFLERKTVSDIYTLSHALKGTTNLQHITVDISTFSDLINARKFRFCSTVCVIPSHPASVRAVDPTTFPGWVQTMPASKVFTHLELDLLWWFLEWRVITVHFPNLTHLAWTFRDGDAIRVLERRIGQGWSCKFWNLELVILHIIEGDKSKWADQATLLENLVKAMQWPQNRCIVIVDDLDSEAAIVEPDIWSRARLKLRSRSSS